MSSIRKERVEAAPQQGLPAQVFIGRQPILDRAELTCAYELLFRPGNSDAAVFNDGRQATAQVIHDALMEFGLDDLVGAYPAYINFTRETLVEDFAQHLPAERVVVEILEDVEIDGELVRKVQELAGLGFRIALDDFDSDAKWEPLIPLADIIKFDVMGLSMETLQAQVQRFKDHEVKLLAEKVETRDEYLAYRELGFDYFQGYFFAKPALVSGRKLPDNHLAILNLLARLQDPDIKIEEVEMLVSQNVSLSYKLLRYINSAAFALATNVESIRQVIVYFGQQRLRNWASLLAMTGVEGKSSELMQTGLIRAKLCELLALETQPQESDTYFMIGLFSILDALMDDSMANIVEKLPITEPMQNALLQYEGEMGAALQFCHALERNDVQRLSSLGLDWEEINGLYMQAIAWARDTQAGVS